VYTGALAYADDIALLAPTARAMRMLLCTFENLGKKFSVSFNAAKSVCMFVSCRHSDVLMTLSQVLH